MSEAIGAGNRIVKYGKRLKKKEWREEASKYKVTNPRADTPILDPTPIG